MSVRTFYRCVVWLPLLVPAAVAFGVHTLGLRPADGIVSRLVQILLVSGVYGGVPYLLLALWATWWIGQRSEGQIRRRALQAPLLMIAVWSPLSFFVGLRTIGPTGAAGFAGLGILMILTLGYAYVALVLGLRYVAGRAGWVAA